MDKRVTKILICCFACTLIVIVLFLIAIHFSQSSCELIQVDRQHLRNSQLNAYNKAKAIRSDDKTILMKFSAYLEYNKSGGDDDNDDDEEKKSTTTTDRPHQQQQQQQMWPNNNQQQQQHAGGNSIIASNAGAAINTMNRTIIHPSNPIDEWAPFKSNGLNGNITATSMIADQHKQQAKKRFLPLDLDSIEARHLSEASNKFKYILSFNCTKMKMVLVRHPDRVYVESIKLELKVSNKHKTECDVQLPANVAFSTSLPPTTGIFSQSFGNNNNNNNNNHTTSNNNNNSELSGVNREFIRYHCRTPQHFPCYHKGGGSSSSNGTKSNGLHIADLHIMAIEFETPLREGSGETKLKHVSKTEFKSQRRNCDLASS